MFKTTDTNTLKQDKKVSGMLVHLFVNHVWKYNNLDNLHNLQIRLFLLCYCCCHLFLKKSRHALHSIITCFLSSVASYDVQKTQNESLQILIQGNTQALNTLFILDLLRN